MSEVVTRVVQVLPAGQLMILRKHVYDLGTPDESSYYESTSLEVEYNVKEEVDDVLRNINYRRISQWRNGEARVCGINGESL